ncbi:MAG: TonB family protein [Myxococcales bacterium]|nr:TonB family protein [Myxococcales bacterium]
MKTVALRTALIWHDEVMSDVVLEKPAAITVGYAGKPTFVIPEIGLPNNFAIVRPGNRGYLLTLAENMRGTICIDGQEKDVSEFVRRGGDQNEPGGFRATPISGRDWGVIELDESGAYKLFFQFVPIDDAQPFFTPPVIKAGLGGYLGSIVALTSLFLKRGINVDFTILDSELLAKTAEGLFRGTALASLVLAAAALIFWISRQEGESQASLSFSVVLHAALLFMTYQLYDGSNPFVWPGPRALTGNYLVTRLEAEKPPEVVKSSGPKVDSGAAAPKTPEKPKNTATKNDQGASGGKGEHERARNKNAKPDDKPEPPKIALLEDKNRRVLDNMIDQNLATSLGKFNGIPGETRRGDLGFGTGTGTGVGVGVGTGTTRGSKGKGSGGGGNVDGDFVSNKGKIDTGTNRPGGGNCATPPCGTAPREVKVALADPSGDFAGLTAEEIDRVVRARSGVFRACYQKELNHSPGIGGKMVIHFQIAGDGTVKAANSGAGSQFHNDAVESCVKTWVMKLRFPAKGGVANVNYPFVFTQGG